MGFLVAAVLFGCADETSGPAAPGAGDQWFREDAESAGLEFVHESGHREGRYLLPEIIVGGAALFDMDNDGDLDVYLVQSGFLLTQEGLSPPNRLFRNRGDGSFEEITAGSGADDTGYGVGVATGDFDRDGFMDLYVTNVGPNVLLRNRGDGSFEDVTAEAGGGDPGWGTSAAFFDYDLDGDLDLFVVNYVQWSMDAELECSGLSGEPDYCSPNSYQAPAPDVLYRNDGGVFVDVSVDAGLRRAFGNGLGVVCSDFDGDGRPDVFVANDQMPNQLWHNEGDGTFTDIALRAGCAVDLRGEAKAGMGVTAEDVDEDGDLDLLVVNLTAQSDSFFRNEGSWFSDATASVGLGASSRRFTRFGTGFIDFDNDGWLDLFQANGRVTKPQAPDALRRDDVFAEPNVLYQGLPGGRFEAMPPLSRIATSRAAAFGDVDNDGGVDVIVLNKDDSVSLLRNVHPRRGRWLMLDVRARDGVCAIGATVTLSIGDRTLRREVRTAYSYCAANDHRIHVGLGQALAVEDVRVRWADEVVESFGTIAADRIVTIRRGDGRIARTQQGVPAS